MSYEEAWKVLADLLTDLRKRGETIPTDVMNDLRSAKTMIQILKADPTHIENVPRIEIYLGNVESYLIFAAQNKLGSDYVEKWMKRLGEARRKIYEEGETKPALRFVPGLPRGERWVRVQVSKDTSRKDIKRLAKENKLSYKIMDANWVLVWGDLENLKGFIQKLREVQRGA